MLPIPSFREHFLALEGCSPKLFSIIRTGHVGTLGISDYVLADIHYMFVSCIYFEQVMNDLCISLQELPFLNFNGVRQTGVLCNHLVLRLYTQKKREKIKCGSIVKSILFTDHLVRVQNFKDRNMILL